MELLNVFLAGEDDAPTHPAAVDALLAGDLVSLLLARCAEDIPGGWTLDALQRATFISQAAIERVGLAGFLRLLSMAERDAALAPSNPGIFIILMKVTLSKSVATAICAEAGMLTL